MAERRRLQEQARQLEFQFRVWPALLCCNRFLLSGDQQSGGNFLGKWPRGF
jgi:hypothetical protein